MARFNLDSIPLTPGQRKAATALAILRADSRKPRSIGTEGSFGTFGAPNAKYLLDAKSAASVEANTILQTLEVRQDSLGRTIRFIREGGKLRRISFDQVKSLVDARKGR